MISPITKMRTPQLQVVMVRHVLRYMSVIIGCPLNQHFTFLSSVGFLVTHSGDQWGSQRSDPHNVAFIAYMITAAPTYGISNAA